MEQIIQDRQRHSGWIGVEARRHAEIADSFRLASTNGVILRILRGRPADRAGLKPATFCLRSKAPVKEPELHC